MTTEIVQIVIEHDGQLCQLVIPQERRAIALHLLRSLFDDGVLAVVKLSADWKKMPLSEAIK